MKQMASVPQPLINITGFDDSDSASFSSRRHKASFNITQIGTDVFNGNADFLDMNGIDLWLGGVHLRR